MIPRKELADKYSAISLFSSAGVGDLGLEAHNVRVRVANELLPKSAALYRENHPESLMIEGDIWDFAEAIVRRTKEALSGRGLFLAYATPPCQGMSTNGAGKLMAEAEAGRRPSEDPRNRLVIPAMDVICALRPSWVLFENVPGMRNTVIRTRTKMQNVLEYISERLAPEYVGASEVLACSDYGIPQLRKRLITVFTRDDNGKKYLRETGGTLFPPHERRTPRTLRDAIAHLPRLDAIAGRESRHDFHPLHYVNVMDQEKYWWIANTPEGETAFNNQCVAPGCGYQGNQRHVDQLQDGRWRASADTPIHCAKCKALLPRPTMIDPDTGERRLIRGFHSAYRRMLWDKPARALTRNYPFEASDNKVHPDQNRVLSTYEALVLQTIAEYDYSWSIGGKPVPRSLIARAIGESVPPKLIEHVVGKIVAIASGLRAEHPHRTTI